MPHPRFRLVLLSSAILLCLVLGWAAAHQRFLIDRPLLPSPGRGDTLTVFYSGDGGWARIDEGVAKGLNGDGIAVIGFNSPRYFLVHRTPQSAADDLAAVLRRYLAEWSKSRVILAGYSFGADALPQIVPLLPADLRARVRLVALLGVGASGDLQFQPGEWLGYNVGHIYPIAPALAALHGMRVVCLYGDADRTSACQSLPAARIGHIRLTGNHHFNGAFGAVAQAIARAAQP